ncbi:MAG: LysM peptidoglycan-binding domain-containing protein [Rikenellaceae bacterium]
MKRFIFLILAILAFVVAPANLAYGASSAERSKSIVFINGSRYYVHSVQKGDTMYSLSKLYDLEESEILAANSTLTDGLKAGINIKIPTKDEAIQKPLSERKQRKIFDSHVVVAGETLYSISKKYEISVQTILEDNPNLDPSALSVGQMLVIRKDEQGLANDKQIRSEIDGYSEQMNRVAPEGYRYHVVVKGDTLYSLARACGVTTAELMKINDMSSESLNLGQIILLKSVASEQEDVQQTVDVEHMVKSVDFGVLRRGETVRIALILPLTINGKVVKPFEEFYKGFLLGVEDLRESGRSVEVNLYNSGRDLEMVKGVVADAEYQNCHLIVGPVYEELLAPVLRDAERRGVPVVSPLATLASADSPVLFQMAPDVLNRNDKMDELISSNRTVTLIYSGKNDAEYDTEVKRMLRDKGVNYRTHEYVYEHPSLVQERQIAAKKRVERMQESAEARGTTMSQELVDSLLRVNSTSDLTSLLMNDAEHNTFFVMSDNEVDVDRILSALASAYTAQVSINRGTNRDLTQLIKFNVVANPAWKRYDNIDKTLYFRDRVVVQSSYHASRDSEVIRDFDSRYGKEFEEFPSLYSYRGYDVAMIFGDGLYSDIQYGMEGRRFKPLQSAYRFERSGDQRHRANINWVRVTYNPDFTLTID